MREKFEAKPSCITLGEWRQRPDGLLDELTRPDRLCTFPGCLRPIYTAGGLCKFHADLEWFRSGCPPVLSPKDAG
jgi:hypothetical protein